MIEAVVSEANRLKQAAGQKLSDQLRFKFNELKNDGVILDFEESVNFAHRGYSYANQYLADFIIETIDSKYVVIRSSTSYRQDRVKTHAYDLLGVSENAYISGDIVALILLYPDSEVDNIALNKSIDMFEKNESFSPATHILFLSELLIFLENHKIEVETELLLANTENEVAENIIKDGSYYGLRGNKFEVEVVSILNNFSFFNNFLCSGFSSSDIFDRIIKKVCLDLNIKVSEIVLFEATNTVIKLRRGGNAKADVILKVNTRVNENLITISIKNTKESRVSCHDYRSEDYSRVLNVQETKLEYYFDLYQKAGSNSVFLSEMSDDDSLEEFENLLSPYTKKLTEWALTGAHDFDNLINPNQQISKYILISKSGNIDFDSFDDYINRIFLNVKSLTYGTPLSWTYPSKMRGKRIQLKMPILIR